jgi:hypothetical protein
MYGCFPFTHDWTQVWTNRDGWPNSCQKEMKCSKCTETKVRGVHSFKRDASYNNVCKRCGYTVKGSRDGGGGSYDNYHNWTA